MGLSSRDLYLGARANIGLTVDGFTGNRYAFTAGNPISRIELDGHCFMDANGVCDSPKNSGSTNDVDSYTLDNGTTLTQTPDGQSYINGYKLPSGGPSAVSLARAIDEFTPLIRDVQAMGPGPLDPSETAGAIAIFCDQEDEQDLCGNEWAFKVHAKQVAKELPEALAASAGGLRGGAVGAAAIASVGKIIRGLVRSGVVAPQTIEFSQSFVSATIRNGASIDELAGALRSGTLKASSIPPVRLFKMGENCTHSTIVGCGSSRKQAFRSHFAWQVGPR